MRPDAKPRPARRLSAVPKSRGRGSDAFTVHGAYAGQLELAS